LADRNRWKEELVNDFEPSVFLAHPKLAELKASLYQAGAYYAAMSGSGSSIFGLFDQKPTFPDWPTEYFVFESLL
jgi:4-diphosphocytidyl-2-C-methyl-D-erythritol kinase